MTDLPIGGYFGSERDVGSGLTWLRHARKYRSARCAIVAVLRVARPERVWIPNYICSAVDDALAAAGIAVRRYTLSSTWSVPLNLDLRESDWLICVDYFGICCPQIDAVLDRFGADRVLVDASQSLFRRSRPKETIVYSPRKFVGVPDGGLLITEVEIPSPKECSESESRTRSEHLRSRREGRLEEGYLQFQQAEESLVDCEPTAMSNLTAGLLDKIDAGRIAARRVANYQLLVDRLSNHGIVAPKLPQDAVPLCCPVPLANAPRIRKELARRRIYSPTYWPGIEIADANDYGRVLRDETVYLPCDQRYGAPEMKQIISSLLDVQDRP